MLGQAPPLAHAPQGRHVNSETPRGLGELYLRLCIVEKGRAQLAEALEYATTREERAYVQQLLREDRARDRSRAYRPDFSKGLWGRRRGE